MPGHPVLTGYNATDEAADGLALAHVLSERLDRTLVVARVFAASTHPEVTDRQTQRAIRGMVADTRRALVAALPDAEDVELMPLTDASFARGLHDLARAEDAEAIVVGSSHHHAIGRLLLGAGPELVADGAPCPVFVAPPGFRHEAALRPEVIGVAYDGTPGARAALRYAAGLAVDLDMTLRILTVHPPRREHPRGGPHDVPALQARARTDAEEIVGGRVAIELAERQGHPATELVLATEDELGLLVVGSRGHGPLLRVLLGSVSAAVLRSSRAPVVVTTG